MTKLNIPEGDSGGEMDPHGADGNGNPIGGLVFSSAFGELQQIHEWTVSTFAPFILSVLGKLIHFLQNFMSYSQFCLRACKPGKDAAMWCEHIYDVMGCAWSVNSLNVVAFFSFMHCTSISRNMPANYSAGVFEKCAGDSGKVSNFALNLL